MQARDIQTRVAQYLSENGPVKDVSGRATHVLKDGVGYTGDTLAFTRILATMSNKGLITRDIRGKRTYAISLSSEGSPAAPAHTTPSALPAASLAASLTPSLSARAVSTSASSSSSSRDDEDPSDDAPSSADVDYDELAYQLLRRVAETLAAKPAGEENSNAGFLQRRLRRAESRVSELERQLARAQAENNQLRDESAELRGRLEAAEQNLSVLTTQLDRRPKRAIANARTRLDAEERAVLRRLAGG